MRRPMPSPCSRRSPRCRGRRPIPLQPVAPLRLPILDSVGTSVSEPKGRSNRAGGSPPAPDSEALPAIDFSTFVLSLSHSALVHLGDAPALEGDSRERDLALAKQTIDLLGILQEKTRNNLSGEEERLLDQVLYDLRLRFVEISKES